MSNYFVYALIPAIILFILADLAIYSIRVKNTPTFHISFVYAQLKIFLDKLLSRFNSLGSSHEDYDLISKKNEQISTLNLASEEQTAFIENPTDSKAVLQPINQDGSKQETDNNVNVDLIRRVHIQFSADIPIGMEVHVTLKVEEGNGQIIVQNVEPNGKNNRLSDPEPAAVKMDLLHAFKITNGWNQISAWIKHWFNREIKHKNFHFSNLDNVFLLAAFLIYALVVSIGIDKYPIYFFTDEAIHMNLVADFIRDGYKNYFGEFLPTFFTTEGWVNGTSVYVQVLPYLIFGKSIVVTRLVSAIISLFGALAVSLLLKDALKLRYYWVGLFMVLTTPAWFLHARTAFEYVEVGSFYSLFLYFYSRYRTAHLRSFYWAILAGALTFYTHGLGQILMGVSGVILFIVDYRYHTHPDQRKTVLNGILLGGLLLLPFARYYLAHPFEAAGQVKRRGSYWTNDNLTFLQKLLEFLRQYFYGLNPQYWYIKNRVDLNRHIMNGYGNGWIFTLPFLVIGLIQTIRYIRIPSYRIVLIALLVCPIPASVVAIGMPRMLWMTIPVALISVIGLSAVLQWCETHWHFAPRWISIGLFIVTTCGSVIMLRDALVNGPTWFEDYSLYGLQYGAKQVFQDVVAPGLRQDTNRRYVVSPSWANGTEQFVDFFIPEDLSSRVNLGQPINFIDNIRKNNTSLYFVATSDEYDKLVTNPIFTNISVSQVLHFPNGNPGFYVLTLQASEKIDTILAEESKINRSPVEDTIIINNQSVRVFHSPIGSGSLEDVFDHNPDSLARVIEANPFTFDLFPTNPITTNGIDIQTGSLPKFTVSVSLYPVDSDEPVIYTQSFSNLPPDPSISMAFDKGPILSSRIYIEILDENSGFSSQIHVRDIIFR